MNPNNILLVDDELVLVRTLGRVLANAGYRVTSAQDGEAALQRLQESPFDLVLTDLAMEGVNGMEVLAEAKRLDPDICVIVATGYCDASSAIEALRLGAEDYLVKPFDFDELLLRVARCLDKRELRRKLHFYENILPICAGCKMIRDDAGREPGEGRWMPLEEYLTTKGGVQVSHGYCPACKETWGSKKSKE